MKKLFQRRNFFIQKELQGKLIFHSFVLAFAGVVIFSLIFSVLSADNLTISYQDQHLQIGRTPLILLKEILTAHWIFLLSVGLFVAVNSLFLSHRIAGPLYRMEMVFTAMEKKDLSQELHLRTKDLGKGLTNQINLINRTFSDDLRQMQTLCAQMEESLEKKGAEGSETAQLRRQTGEMKQILAAYRLHSEGK